MLELLDLWIDKGFAIFVAALLLWDKLKTNGKLTRVVENNTQTLKRIEDRLNHGNEIKV